MYILQNPYWSNYNSFCPYVDDILIFSTNIEIIVRTNQFLSRCFNIKDLGKTYYTRDQD